VAGQTTSGTYAFTNVNQPGGAVQVNITPAMAEPIPVSISGVPATVSVGGSMTATATVSDGTANPTYVWYLNGVSAGMGPSYTLGSTVVAGWYRLDVTAYAAGGARAGSATMIFQITKASAAAGPYLYVVNFGSRTVAACAVGPGGQLTPLSIPTVATGTNPEAIAATPNGSFLYVTNTGSDTVSAYAIGSDGLLAPLNTPLFATGSEPYAVAVTPDGSFLYVANAGSNTVSAYAVGADGMLTPLSNRDVAAGYGPAGIAVAPNGSFLYVADYAGQSVSAFTINSRTGVLTEVTGSPFPAAGQYTMSVAVDPTSQFVYACNFLGEGSLSAYRIDPRTGALTQMPGSPFSTGASHYAIAITPNGRFLYTTDPVTNFVSAYAIGSGGVPTPLSTPSYTIGPLGEGWSRQGAALTPDGRFLYVTSNVGVTGYAIGSDGLLTPLGTPGYGGGGTTWGITVVAQR
jgi:6-phosphogluconolactonase (cycloisomerase 2 family)